jgi:glycosyltransferase involved in cell wall biosynthesis
VSQRPRLRVILVVGGDPEGGGGGTESFVRNVVPHLSDEVAVAGAVTGTPVLPGWSMRDLNGRVVPYFPLLRLPEDRRRPRVPVRLRALFAAWRSWPKLVTASDVLYLHAPELAFPALIRGPRVSYVLHMHGWADPLEHSRFAVGRWRLVRAAYAELNRAALRRATRVIVVSAEGQRGCEAVLGAAAAQKCALVPTCYDERVFHLASRAGDAPGDAERPPFPTLAYVGRVEESKGYDLLLPILERISHTYPEARLVVVGDGSGFQELERQAQDVGISTRVALLGWLQPAGVATVLQEADVVLLPSKEEGLPTVALEALACGTPVVGTNVGGLGDLLADSVAGERVDMRDPEAFSAAIQTVLRRGLRRADVAAVAPKYASASIAAAVADVLRSAYEGGKA